MNNKGYEKALYLYNNGSIEKAIEICEKEISRDLSNSKVLNLKGLLLYLNGDLEDAIAIWKINKDYNDDEISSLYLKDVKDDFKKLELYKEAKGLIEDLSIGEALDILVKCSESDFNSINVNNALASCYLRRGDNDKVKEYLDKVFKLDRDNQEAKIINKKIDNIYRYKKGKEKIIKITLASIVIVTIITFALLKGEDIINSKFKANDIQVDNSYVEDKEAINKEIVEEKEEENELAKVLNNDEIKENYIRSTSYYQEGRYKEAKDLLEETISKSNANHLDDDIIFLLASSYEAIGSMNKAVGNYDKYILNYEDGSYIKEAYYRATLIYKDINIEKSKEYANKIIINYPNSIYNNNYVKEIMKL